MVRLKVFFKSDWKEAVEQCSAGPDCPGCRLVKKYIWITWRFEQSLQEASVLPHEMEKRDTAEMATDLMRSLAGEEAVSTRRPVARLYSMSLN